MSERKRYLAYNERIGDMDALVIVDEDDVSSAYERRYLQYPSRKEALLDFMAIHWAWEIDEEIVKRIKGDPMGEKEREEKRAIRETVSGPSFQMVFDGPPRDEQ